MRARIARRRTLSQLLSASAMERVGAFWYMVADDSPDLYRLDETFRIASTLRLVESPHTGGERVAKHAKLDLEAMTLVERNGKHELLLFGSGSKPVTRDFCFRVNVTRSDAPQLVQTISLTPLYDTLRRNPRIVGAQQLNLEAAASTADTLFLLQRGNISEHNSISAFDLAAFYAFLENPAQPPPSPQLFAFTLPQIQKQGAGFSAATVLSDGQILFAATVEDTPDEVQDGPTLGSFIGILQTDKNAARNIGTPRWILPVQDGQELARVKIEGIAIKKQDAASLQLYAVTDNDTGESEILEIEIA